MIDVNRYGLHYAVLAATPDFAGYIVDYGKYPPGQKDVIWSEENHGGKTEAQAIYDAIINFCTELCARKYPQGEKSKMLDLITVDCGYQMDVVFRAVEYANSILPVEIVASRGRAHKHYRETHAIGRLGDNCHRAVWKSKGRVLIHNADYWRSRCQQGWLCLPGSPASLSLYGKTTQHDNFCEQICSEILREHVQTENAEMYVWVQTPGVWNDLLDAVVGAMAACNILGASFDAPGVGGWKPAKAPTKPKQEREAVRQQENNPKPKPNIRKATICEI
jgi:hypothetical protein